MSPGANGRQLEIIAGRYALHRRIASGGMASVYLGRVFGHGGFSRVVAVKRLHPQFGSDPVFAAGLVDEARMASRIRHPNVVPVLDVVSDGDEVLLVMEYAHGEKLSTLVRRSNERGQRIPIAIVAAVIGDTLRGLHAAHEARAPDGTALGIVHRDVSPQNVLVTTEGVSQVVDFGIAKALGRSQTTREGQLKGKLAYMALEQLSGAAVTRRTDVCAASIVMWEMVTGERLYSGDSDASIYAKIMQQTIPALAARVKDVPDALQQVVSRGLAPRPEDRFATALEMADALERAVRPATRAEVAAWVEELAGDVLRERAGYVAEVERSESEPAVPRATEEAAVVAAESTQLSTMGVSRPVASRANASSRVLIIGALSLAALASAAWFASDLGGGPADVPVLRKSTGALAPAVAAIEQPPPIAASASADAAAPATRPTTPAAPVRRAAPTRPKPKPPCKYRDADGIWHIRPGCL